MRTCSSAASDGRNRIASSRVFLAQSRYLRVPSRIFIYFEAHFRLVLVILMCCYGAWNWRPSAAAQASPSSMLVETGKISVSGHEASYRISHLPVNAFPDLPEAIASALNARGCLIPQTYEAHRPENVVHGSFERVGSKDWAVLCSVNGRVSLLVFFASALPSNPLVLASTAETARLQSHDSSGELGFNWGIDAASPTQVHDAQAGMAHRPPPPDHDCLADSMIDHQTIYRCYRNGAWVKLDMEE